MFRTHGFLPRPVVAQLILLMVLLLCTMAQATVPYRLPEKWAPYDAATMDANNQSMALRIAEDSHGLLAKNAELLAGDLDQSWTLYNIARNADTALGRVKARQAIADRDVGALTGQQVTQANIGADGWLLMQATGHWLGDRYATAEAELTTLLERRPEWSPALNFMRWNCLRARLSPLPEIQACLDDQMKDSTTLCSALFWLINLADDDKATLEKYRAFIDQGPDVPQVRIMVDLIDIQLAWLDQAPTARSLTRQWHQLTDTYGDLAYRVADTFSYEITSQLPGRQSLPMLSEFGREPLGMDFRLRKAEQQMRSGQELEAGAFLSRLSNGKNMTLTLKLNYANLVGSADSLRSTLDTIRQNVISISNSSAIQYNYTLLAATDTWGEVWAELERENPAATIRHRLDQVSVERLPELLALRDSLQSLDTDLLGYEHRFATLDAAMVDEVDLAAIAAEPSPRQRRNLYRLARVTAEFRGDHELSDQLILSQISTTDDANLVRNLATDKVINGDQELARVAMGRLSELGDEEMGGLEFRILATNTLEGPEAARSILTPVNVNLINSIEVLSDIANMSQYLNSPEQMTAARNRLQALVPASFTAKMVAVSDERNAGDNGAAVTILRDLAAEYPGNQRVSQLLMELGDSVVALDTMPVETFDRAALFTPFGDDLDDLDKVLGRKTSVTDTTQADFITLLSRRSMVLTGLNDAYNRQRTITQIVSRAGANSWRSFTFTFDPSNGVPHVRTARVFTPDGRVLETDLSTILVRAPSEENSDVSDTREMVIPLRGVEPGALIDVTYDMQNGAYLEDTWSMLEFFVTGTLTHEYIFEMLAPDEHPVYAIVHGDITTIPPDPVTGVRQWVYHDLPTFDDESNRPSMTEIIPWIGLTTFPDWNAVGLNYGTRFWQTAGPTPRLKALADSLTQDADGKTEKAAALYRYVVEEITPLAVELEAGRLVPSTCDEVLDRKWGDCKDNSHLLVSLLLAAGIEARPVLVSTVGHFVPRADLPSLSFFDHMIVQITGIKDKPYCDPLNGSPCLDAMPAMSAGRMGLHLNDDGTSSLAEVSPPRPEDHVTALEVDVTPVGERSLLYEIQASYTGDIASYMKQITSFGDTNVTRSYLDRAVGYGVPGGVPIASWSVTDGDCGTVEIAMTYLDTTWTDLGESSASLHHPNEGSVYWELPPSKDRRYDVIFPSTYTSRLVLRLHGNEVWTPADHFVAFSVDNAYSRGEIEGKKSKEDGRRLLTVNHDFVLTEREIGVDSYQDFQRDAIAFSMFSNQRHDYRRVLDKDMIKEIRQYAEQNPHDEGFRLNAAANLLGSDMGGLDDEGGPRRAAAMDLLMPLVEIDAPNTMATMLAARIHMKRNKYRLADKVISDGLVHSNDDLYLHSLASAINTELENWDIAAEHLAVLANKLGNASIIQQYALALLMLGDEDGASQQLERMRLLGQPLTELQETSMRFIVAEKADDLEGMTRLLSRMEELGEEEDVVDLVRCSIYSSERRTALTIPLLEGQLAENPGSSFLCNNLAWSYAICGQNLDRALMLSRAASVMSDDPASSRNTYATILARQGDWKEARKIFRDMYENDDRPQERKVNGYFLGLAEVELGNQDRAREVWQSIVDLPATPAWSKRVRQSLQALDEGGDVTASIFEG